jgi:hypothetical protein
VALRGLDGHLKAETVSDHEGVYRFPSLAPGSYRLEATAETPEPLGAVAGKNPLRLAPGVTAWVGLQAVPREEPIYRPVTEPSEGFGRLAGTVRFRGQAVSGAVVYLYLDEDQELKGPGYRQSFPTGPDGVYEMDEVAEGEYFVAVRKRKTGELAGPVRLGDLYGVVLTNPVAVRSGEETVLPLHLVRKVRDDDPNLDLLALTETGIRGRVVDVGRRPVAGAYVFAYRNRIIGHGKPDFLTLPTGPDGTFSLPLGEGGLFYVGARERAGGSPAPGERFGLYEGTPDHGIVVPHGKILDEVDIAVREVLEPWPVGAQLRDERQEVPIPRPVPQGQLPGDLHTMPTESITGQAVWEGEVVVERIVIVRSGGHLTIRPGTQVLFRRSDWDGDGIGDAEITVEGRLTAEGTPGQPILFASAEPDPKPGDWKYLMINFAAGATVSFARISHAFSGIQVHYSPARVRRCEFVANVDGVRFSTARLRVEESWIHENTNGVRFEERGHAAEIVANEIADNHVGIFAVTESRGRSVFRHNNIRRNRYPVKLGWEQPYDLAFPENHWGREDEAEILESVFDGRKDPALGRVSLTPVLPRPAPVAVPPFPVPDESQWHER